MANNTTHSTRPCPAAQLVGERAARGHTRVSSAANLVVMRHGQLVVRGVPTGVFPNARHVLSEEKDGGPTHLGVLGVIERQEVRKGGAFALQRIGVGDLGKVDDTTSLALLPLYATSGVIKDIRTPQTTLKGLIGVSIKRFTMQASAGAVYHNIRLNVVKKAAAAPREEMGGVLVPVVVVLDPGPAEVFVGVILALYTTHFRTAVEVLAILIQVSPSTSCVIAAARTALVPCQVV